MKGRHPRNFHVIREFGAIGSVLSMAMGVAVARGNGKVVVLDGDGSIMMHIQELDSIQRQKIKLLVVALNDGGFGVEFHKLRPHGLDDRLAFFGRPNFESITKGFGLKAATATDAGQIEAAFRDYDPDGPAMMIDLHISDKVVDRRW
jgi:thiamine pyrophosphate-dependent acetolactate synthase large subunit-like protein